MLIKFPVLHTRPSSNVGVRLLRQVTYIGPFFSLHGLVESVPPHGVYWAITDHFDSNGRSHRSFWPMTWELTSWSLALGPQFKSWPLFLFKARTVVNGLFILWYFGALLNTLTVREALQINNKRTASPPCCQLITRHRKQAAPSLGFAAQGCTCLAVCPVSRMSKLLVCTTPKILNFPYL